MSFLHKEKAKEEETMTMVPILCKFWREDDVWNASAEHLSVAAFGQTFEEAQQNLSGALVSHIECWVEAGKGEELFAKLHEHSRDYMRPLNEMPDREPLVKMQFGIRDHQVCAAV